MSRGANGMVLLNFTCCVGKHGTLKNVFQLVLYDSDIYRQVRNLCGFAQYAELLCKQF